MGDNVPLIQVTRHYQSAWSLSVQHRGYTDQGLTEPGQRTASRFGKGLRDYRFAEVSVGPFQRAAPPRGLATSKQWLESLTISGMKVGKRESCRTPET